MNTITIKDLFEKYRVIVPAIQRDYAQGREDKKHNNIKGKGFFDYILNNNDISIDLIYAYKNNLTDELYPIDGQQRLTSIWLTIMFFYSKLDNTNKLTIPSKFKDFTYETRVSSTRFFKKLLDEFVPQTKNLSQTKTLSNSIIFLKTILDKDSKKEIRNGKTITNENWFLNSWKQDPTIKGIINAYDYLGEYYEKNKNNIDCNQIISNLLSIKLNLIEQSNNTVEFVDAYIKMNDRGKLLSNFDNLKADIIEFSSYNQFPNYKNLEIGINNNWNDLFFNNCLDKKTFEEEFFTFLNLLLLTEEIKKTSGKIKGINAYKLFKIVDYKEEFEEISNYIDDSFIGRLSHFFTNIQSSVNNINDLIHQKLPTWAYNQSNIKDFKFIAKSTKDYDPFKFYNIILFYGIYIFSSATVKKITEEDWYRIVCNIVEDEDISDVNRLRPIINKIDTLFSSLNGGSSQSLDGVYKSEYDKYNYKINNKCKKDIEDEENNNFYSGYIDFVFLYDRQNSNYDIDKTNLNVFKKRKKIVDNKVFLQNGFANKNILQNYFKYLVLNGISNDEFLKHTRYSIEKIDVNSGKNDPFENDARRKMFKNMLKDDEFKLYFEDIIINSVQQNPQNKINIHDFEGLYNNDEFYKYYIAEKFSTNDNLKWTMDEGKYIRLAGKSTNDRVVYLDYEKNKKIIDLGNFCNVNIKTIPDEDSSVANDNKNKTSTHPIIVLDHNKQIFFNNNSIANIEDVLKIKTIKIKNKNIKNQLQNCGGIKNDKINFISNSDIDIDKNNASNDEICFFTDCIVDDGSFKKEIEDKLNSMNIKNVEITIENEP